MIDGILGGLDDRSQAVHCLGCLVNIPGNQLPGCPHLVLRDTKKNPQNLADNQNLRIVSFPGASYQSLRLTSHSTARGQSSF